MTSIIIRKAEDRIDYGHCVQLRTSVFVHGQSVPPEMEVDKFENDCHHYVAFFENQAAGTVRWRVSQKDQTIAKIERLATLSDFRGNGIGKALMSFIIQDIETHSNIKTVILGSQDHAVPFYEAMGFEISGDGYLDGGTIPHHDMKLEIR